MKTNSKRKGTKIVRVLVIVLVVFMVGSWGYYQLKIQPVQKQSEKVAVEVKPGDTMFSLIDVLEENQVIQSASVSKLYAKVTGKNHVESGVYYLDKSWSTPTIIDTIHNYTPTSEVSVQLNEMDWAKTMAEKIAAVTSVSKEELLDLWNDETYVTSLIDRYEVLTSEILVRKDDVRVLLEGYLYPDTYRFHTQTTKEEVTEKILDNAERKYQEYKDLIPGSGFSLHETITLSSVVLYEASSYEDQQMVSGVFRNRFEIGMKMESSVTVCYALYEFNDWTDCERYTNQKIDSLYNTYLYPGLPAGPIMNPNVSVIMATLNPIDHDYYFFVADVYGDGLVHYSKTYQEHLDTIESFKK